MISKEFCIQWPLQTSLVICSLFIKCTTLMSSQSSIFLASISSIFISACGSKFLTPSYLQIGTFLAFLSMRWLQTLSLYLRQQHRHLLSGGGGEGRGSIASTTDAVLASAPSCPRFDSLRSKFFLQWSSCRRAEAAALLRRKRAVAWKGWFGPSSSSVA